MELSSHGSAERRRFLASLRDDGATSNQVQTKVKTEVISFSIQKLREFKGSQMIAASFKAGRPEARLRPNYNSTKRKLCANPVERMRYLVMFEERFSTS